MTVYGMLEAHWLCIVVTMVANKLNESSDVNLQGSIEIAGELRFQNVLVGVSPAGIILGGGGN